MPLPKKRYWQLGGFLAFAGALLLVGKPAYLIVSAWLHDRHDRVSAQPGNVEDASRLNETHVAEVWPIPGDFAEAEVQLRELLLRARRDKLGVSIAGAKHSMGGHTICPDGIVIDMLPFHRMELDAPAKILRVGAGARWSQVVPFLDAGGLSVGIMQSNNDRRLGGVVPFDESGW
jgi:FAD binding domain